MLLLAGVLLQLAAGICWLVTPPDVELRWWAAGTLLQALSCVLFMAAVTITIVGFVAFMLTQILFVALFTAGTVASALAKRQMAHYLRRDDLSFAATALVVVWLLVGLILGGMTFVNYLTARSLAANRPWVDVGREWLIPCFFVALTASVLGTLILGWILRAAVLEGGAATPRPASLRAPPVPT